MKKTDEMRPEYGRAELGRGVRGKYLRRYSKGTNLVLPDDAVAQTFPNAQAVNDALQGPISLADKVARPARKRDSR